MEKHTEPETSGQTSFEDRLRYIRGNLNQTEFSNLIGVHRNTVSGWETGTLMLSCENLVNFRELLNVNLNWLFSGKDVLFLDDLELATDQEAEGDRPISRVVVIHRGGK